MATSGTIGTTTFTVMQLIEQACRRCKVSPTVLTADNIESAKMDLYLLATDLSNRGVNLWTVEQEVLSLNAEQAVYDLPPGTVNLLNAYFRTQTYVTGTLSSSATALTCQFSQAERVDTVGVDATASGTANLVIEQSSDGISWETIDTPSRFAAVAGTRYWFDLNPSANRLLIRVRETVAVSIGFTNLLLARNPYEIAMSPMSRDIYTTLPNKQARNSRPLQYWFDKQITPRIWLWPVPTDSTTLISLWLQRHPQDVGALTYELAVPMRWHQYVIFSLAHKMSLTLPGVPGDVTAMLDQLQNQHLLRAEDGEIDSAPIQIGPSLRYYTRG